MKFCCKFKMKWQNDYEENWLIVAEIMISAAISRHLNQICYDLSDF